MLQSLRESLKGPAAKIVVAVAVGAMVLFGVESLFVNSVAGTNVASVNGDDISQVELRRAMEQQKNRVRQQFQLEETSDMLSDESLRGPALMSLVKQKSLEQAAKASGMGVAPEIIKAELAKIFVRDGKFDSAFLNNYIASYGYTPATLAQSEANSYVLRQLFSGVSDTEFLTSSELAAMAAIATQKRSFDTVFISREKVASTIQVSDDEINEYYESRAAEFTLPEKISLAYVELSAKSLAAKQQVTDSELRSEYDRELAEFVSKTEYQISHILLDAKVDSKITELKEKLAKGDDFTALAKEYSIDLGSNNTGGNLGLLEEGVFPDAFEKAVKALDEGQVSEPVETDSGVHFIKLVRKQSVNAPSFEDRKEALLANMQEQKASIEYLDNIQLLEDAVFNQGDLDGAAKTLGIDVATTELFSREGGSSGIVADSVIIEAAFAEDVYLQGQNSRVIELDGDRAVVIRLKEKIPAKLRELSDVRSDIVSRLTETKVATALQSLAADVIIAIEQDKAVDVIAQKSDYPFVSHENVARSAADVDFNVSREAFAMARPAPGSPSSALVTTEKGLTVVILKSVSDGKLSEFPAEQRSALEQQLKNQLASSAVDNFEAAVFNKAKYKLK
ncbi:MAG: SurA N-terminal domain-containing protein [Marinagarivorans sp.]|nr:SurA N-terminal domain-containing protein [Marinagarivorans sp.]